MAQITFQLSQKMMLYPKVVKSYYEIMISMNHSLSLPDPPYVTVEHSSLDNLEEERDSVTLRCLANSNPPPKVWWQKEGINGIFSPDGEIVISPITRNSAGTYKCMAENALGLSEPTYVEINVKCKKNYIFVIVHK
jgi:hypothetical protein